MTLPEIPKEESKEQETTPCPDCGRPCKNLGVHQRYCKARKDKSAMKQEPLLDASVLPQSQPPAEPLIISNVQPYIGDDVAWFEGKDNKYYLQPRYIGIVNNIPMVLVLFNDGAIIPPTSIPGFIGMLPRDSKFQTSDDTEPFPPFPEEDEDKPKTLLEKIETNHPDIKEAMKPAKKHWWSRTPKATPQDKDKEEVMRLVEGAINVTG